MTNKVGRPKKNINPNLGKSIKKLRKANRLTQNVLAQRVGVSTDTIRNWEKGRSQPSSAKLWVSLSSSLNISVTQLFDDIYK